MAKIPTRVHIHTHTHTKMRYIFNGRRRLVRASHRYDILTCILYINIYIYTFLIYVYTTHERGNDGVYNTRLLRGGGGKENYLMRSGRKLFDR